MLAGRGDAIRLNGIDRWIGGVHLVGADAEWRWDRRKITIYFTAEKRVDFRNLVRELASQFRTRIEMRFLA